MPQDTAQHLEHKSYARSHDTKTKVVILHQNLSQHNRHFRTTISIFSFFHFHFLHVNRNFQRLQPQCNASCCSYSALKNYRQIYYKNNASNLEVLVNFFCIVQYLSLQRSPRRHKALRHEAIPYHTQLETHTTMREDNR